MKSIFLTSILVIVTSFLISFQAPVLENINKIDEDLVITILYDNYKFMEDLEADWGFSCLIEGLEKTILFDAGTKGNILLSNGNNYIKLGAGKVLKLSEL
jgi:hypothetical protein